MGARHIILVSVALWWRTCSVRTAQSLSSQQSDWNNAAFHLTALFYSARPGAELKCSENPKTPYCNLHKSVCWPKRRLAGTCSLPPNCGYREGLHEHPAILRPNATVAHLQGITPRGVPAPRLWRQAVMGGGITLHPLLCAGGFSWLCVPMSRWSLCCCPARSSCLVLGRQSATGCGGTLAKLQL